MQVADLLHEADQLCSAVKAAASARAQWQIDSLAALDLGSGRVLDTERAAGTGECERKMQGSDSELRQGISGPEAREQRWQHSREEARQHDREEVADIYNDSRSLQSMCQPHPQMHDDQRQHQMQLQFQWQQLQEQQLHDETNASRCQSLAAARDSEVFAPSDVRHSVGRPEEADCAGSLYEYGASPGSCSAGSYNSYITLAPPPSPSPPPHMHQHPIHHAEASAAAVLAANAEARGNGSPVLAAVRRFEAPIFSKPDSQCSTPHIEPPPSQPPLKFSACNEDVHEGKERPAAASPEANMAASAKLFWQQYHAGMTESDDSDSDSDSIQSDCNDRG